jgi:hypothetical protein
MRKKTGLTWVARIDDDLGGGCCTGISELSYVDNFTRSF